MPWEAKLRRRDYETGILFRTPFIQWFVRGNWGRPDELIITQHRNRQSNRKFQRCIVISGRKEYMTNRVPFQKKGTRGVPPVVPGYDMIKNEATF